MNTLKKFTWFLLLIIIFVVSISAKEIILKKPDENKQKINLKQNSALIEQINFARKLMAGRNYKGASAILEVLYEENSDNSTIISNLINCYDQLKFLEKAEFLILRQIKKYPNNMHYQLLLAETYLKQNKTENAKAAYKKAINLNTRQDNNRYLSTIRSMMRYGADDQASELINKVRIIKNDSALFATELGNILELKRSYPEATLEYLKVLDDTTRIGITAESKLMALLEFEESSKPTEKIILANAEKYDNPRLPKLLSAYYLKTYQYDKAFQYAIKLDSLNINKGLALEQYLMNCIERKLYHQAVKMGKYLLSNMTGKPIKPNIYFLYADALSMTEQYDHAIAVYDSIIIISPHIQDKSMALFNIGKINADRLNNCNDAIIYYDSVIANYQGGLGLINAKLARPHCFLRIGELNTAEQEFKKLLNGRLDENSKEKIEYTLALLKFFNKQFDSTEIAMQKLLLDYPRGYYVNDAIQILMVIDETEKNESLLHLYSSALMFEQLQNIDSTESKLRLLVDHEIPVLADNALYKLYNLNISRADTTKAISFIKQMENKFPKSYYLPYCLKAKADILMISDNNNEQAKNIYKTLLEKYSNYPFISEVRKILREVDTNNKTS